MTYKTFLQRLIESEDVLDTMDVEDQPKKERKGEPAHDFGDEIHGIAEDLLDEELAEALGQGDTKEAYEAACRAIRDLHKIVCPECSLGGEGEDDDEDDEELKLTEAEGPQQIADVYEFFPKNSLKAATRLADRGDLFLGDLPVIVTPRGHLFVGDGIGGEFDTTAFIEGIITDHDGQKRVGNFDIDVTGTLGEVVKSSYDPEYNELQALVEFEIDDTEFWRDFEKGFRKEFGVAFEDENPEHEIFATMVHRKFLANPVVEVTVDKFGVDVSELVDNSRNA